MAVFVTGGQTGVKATGRIPQHIQGTIVMGCIPAILAVFVTGDQTGVKATGRIPHIHGTMTVIAVKAVRGNMTTGEHDHLEMGLEEIGAMEVIEAVGMTDAVHLEGILEAIGAMEVIGAMDAIGAVHLGLSLIVAVGKPDLLTMMIVESDKAPSRGMRRLET